MFQQLSIGAVLLAATLLLHKRFLSLFREEVKAFLQADSQESRKNKTKTLSDVEISCLPSKTVAINQFKS